LILLISFGLSMLSYVFGRHVSEVVLFLWHRMIHRKEVNEAALQESDVSSESFIVTAVIVAGCVLFICCTTTWIMLAVFLKRSRAFWLALLFGPPGTLIRFYLSQFNTYTPRFPVFTFFVNITGTALYGGMLILYHRLTHLDSVVYFHIASDSIGYVLIPAITLGFCGSLTTVSTFVHEIYLLKPKYAYLYAIASVAVAQLSLLIINFPYWR